MRALGVALLLVATACSSSTSNCPSDAPGTGEACTGNGTCVYGPLSCFCDDQAWDCDLPFTPAISEGGDDESETSYDESETSYDESETSYDEAGTEDATESYPSD
jgi:hypothetical protein